MAQTLIEAIADIQGKVKELSGIKAAPDIVQDNIMKMPFSVCYPRAGSFETHSAGIIIGLHTIVCELHFSASQTAKAVEAALPFAESFPVMVYADPALNNKVSTVLETRYTFGDLKWGDQWHTGWRFEIDLKIQPDTS